MRPIILGSIHKAFCQAHEILVLIGVPEVIIWASS